MSDFENFKLNLNGRTLPIAKEHRVRISISSDYEWGSGWNELQSKRFENVVYTALTKSGEFYIKNDDNSPFYCPHLKSYKSKMDLYIHPMEFTGYATPEEMNKVIDILSNECSSVIYHISIQEDEKIYDLSDKEYKEILIDNTKEIINEIAKTKEERGFIGDIGFDFARECRIPRYGDGTGLGCFDTDIATVNDMAKFAEKMGYFNKTKNFEEIEDIER